MKSANTVVIFVVIVFSVLLTSCSSSLKTNQNIDFGVSSQPDKVLYNMFPAAIEGMNQFIINPNFRSRIGFAQYKMALNKFTLKF